MNNFNVILNNILERNGDFGILCMFGSFEMNLIKVFKMIIYCVIIFGFFFGNLFVIIVVYKRKRMRIIINYMIVSMVVSDLFFVIFVILLFIWIVYVG